MSSDEEVDLQAQHRRIMDAWREMRRGESMQAYRELLFDGQPVLELGQTDALDLLIAAGGMRVGELAKAIRVERSTATRAVDRLEKAGLAQRVRVPGKAKNSTSVIVTPTERGIHLAAEMNRQRLALLDRVCRDFSPAQTQRLAEDLTKLVKGIDRVVAEAALQKDR